MRSVTITKDGDIVITAYHHPSSWMHPNDRNEFNRWIMNKSDFVCVGHEHLGRNELVKTRDTSYHAQYGEVLQERNDANSSGFIINYIEDDKIITHVYNWKIDLGIYDISYVNFQKF